jgi:glucose-6-phosphate 1-dehydrogenase
LLACFCLYYQEAFKTKSPDAYQTLLADVMATGAILSMRADQVEASWSVLMPILQMWEKSKPIDFPYYKYGTGPTTDALITQNGRSWLPPRRLTVTRSPPSGGDKHSPPDGCGSGVFVLL